MQAQIFAPAAVLVLWSLIMLTWMAASRFPALARSGMDLKNAAPGGRGQNLEGVLPDKVNWKSHNYAHLMEQPTLFYAVVIMLGIVGPGATDVMLAWIYVVLRIVHSLWQALVNKVSIRFLIFLLGTIALLVLAVRLVLATLFADPAVVA